MATNIINLTPNTINVIVDDETRTIKPCGTVCRVIEDTKVEGLPPQKDGTIYIVSGMAASAAWELGRKDVYCPFTDVDDIIRNIAIKAFKDKQP